MILRRGEEKTGYIFLRTGRGRVDRVEGETTPFRSSHPAHIPNQLVLMHSLHG